MADLSSVGARNQPAATAAFYAINYAHQGILNGGIFAAGLSAILWGWAGRRKGGLPTALNYVVLVAGVISLLSVAIQPLYPLLFIISIIWSVWLGLTPLQEPVGAAASS